MTYKELKELIFNPSQKKGLENHADIQLYRRGSTVFLPRAILLVLFMLRDSKVALEVRNQALNIIESSSDEHN